MPYVTYYSESEVDSLRDTGDPELNQLIEDVKRASGVDWFVRPYRYAVGMFWWKREMVRYEIYVETDAPEYQNVNFATRDGSTWSINHIVPVQEVKAFLMGYMCGNKAKSEVKG